MLTLTNNRVYDDSTDGLLTTFHRLQGATESINHLFMPRIIEIYHALVPVKVNGFKMTQCSYAVRNTESAVYERVVEYLKKSYEILGNKEIDIEYIFTEDVEGIADSLDKDLFKNASSTIASLYNKCMMQAQLRMGIDHDINIKVKQSKTKDMVVVILDTQDLQQASDIYLTIGLLPVFFEDFKQTLEEFELDYFKALVSRSQLKRVSNADVINNYNRLFTQDKYDNYYRLAKLKSGIVIMLDNKQNALREQEASCNSRAQNALDTYTRELNKYYGIQKELELFLNDRDSIMEEYFSALNVEGVVDASFTGDELKITFRAPYSFFNKDEIECYMNHLEEDDVVYKMFKDVFLDEKYKLMVETIYYFNTKHPDNFRRPGQMNITRLNADNAWFNPHIEYYSCLGDYEPQLRQAHVKGDLLMFNNLAVASTKSINFRDGAVIGRFARDIRESAEYYINSSGQDMNRAYYLMKTNAFVDEEGKTHSFAELYLDEQEQEVQTIEVEEV